jgi:hypothetical protein
MANDFSFKPTNNGFSLAGMDPMAGISRVAQDPRAALKTPGINQDFLNSDFAAGDTNLGFNPAEGLANGLGGNTGSPWDWKGALEGFSLGAQGIMGLANSYNAYKQLGLMEDQFNFARADRNQNVSNQAAITNERLGQQRAAEGRQMGLRGEELDKFRTGGTTVSGAAV